MQCTCTCIHMYIHVYISSVCTCIYISSVCTCIHVHVLMCVHVACMCVHVRVWLWGWGWVNVRVCVLACVQAFTNKTIKSLHRSLVPRTGWEIGIASPYTHIQYMYTYTSGLNKRQSTDTVAKHLNVHVNHKRSLTHHPSSQGWAPRCPIHFVFTCLYCLGVVYWVWVFFLLFLYDYFATVLYTCTCMFMDVQI